jgi:hypothetical protein
MKKILLVIALALPFVCAVFLFAGRPRGIESTIPSHLGDGTFLDLSHRRGPFMFQGYSVTMPMFDMGVGGRGEYRVARLPYVGKQCGVHLAFCDSKASCWTDEEIHQIAAEIDLELVDSRNNVLIKTKGKLGEYIWCRRADMVYLYRLNGSFFVPKTEETYCVRFVYRQDNKLAGVKGFAYLLCDPDP